MKKLGVILFFGLLLSVQSAFALKAWRIMPLGDSITEGGYTLNGVYQNEGGGYRYPLEIPLLRINPRIQFVGSLQHGPPEMPQKNHEGHSGWKIEDIAVHLDQWLTDYKPDMILLMLGTNDMWDQKYRETAVEKYSELLDQIHRDDPKAKIFAASIIRGYWPETNSFIETFNAGIKKVVDRDRKKHWNIIWVDMNRLSGVSNDDLIDKVHPTPEGYSKMAKVWYDAVSRDVAR